MSVYVKIDENGEVVEFPYRDIDFMNTPEDAVLVDTQTNKPTDLKWYEGIWYDELLKVDGTYQVTFARGMKKYSSEEEKKSTLSILVADAQQENMFKFNRGVIKTEIYESNKQILDSINIDDESTYDLYNTIEL